MEENQNKPNYTAEDGMSVYYTDGVNPIYVNPNTGDVSFKGIQGGIVLPEVTVKGRGLKAKEHFQDSNIYKLYNNDKPLERTYPEFEILTLGYGTGISDKAINAASKSLNKAFTGLKYSKLGERIRGIKVTSPAYHGSPIPFNIKQARITRNNTDTGFHVGSTEETPLFFANTSKGGVIYKGKLQLKEEPFEVEDFNRWTPEQFQYQASLNPKFKEYLERHGITDKILDNIISKSNTLVDGTSEKMKSFEEVLKNSGIALKYKNTYEHFGNYPYSYYLTNPKQVHFTEKVEFPKDPVYDLVIDPYEYIKSIGMKNARGDIPYTKLKKGGKL